MIKNRTAQLIYQTVYCTLGLVGIVAGFGIFDDVNNLHWTFYVHFTNVSNYLCIVVMFLCLFRTIQNKEDAPVTFSPLLKFIGIIGILMTFFIFNIMLAGAEGREPQANWRIGSLLFHQVLPVMYVADWYLFYERGSAKWWYPFASISFPLAYFMSILTQAFVLNFDSSILIPNTQTPLIYPYFFLNFETQGIGGVIKWLVILLFAVIAVGFLLFGIEKLLMIKKRPQVSDPS